MIRKYAVFFVLLLLAFGRAGAQTIVHGDVQSSKGFPVEGVTVKLSHSKFGASTDSTGSFSFKTPLTGKYHLVFSAVGYKTDSIPVSIKGDSLLISYKIKEASNTLDAVSIDGRRRVDNIDMKRGTVLNSFEIATTAGAVADIASSLRTLPGAAPQSNETGLFIRGGDAHETGAYMDGLLLKNPFGSRLPDISNRSRFSAFTFKESTFSSGGYSAQYGQVLSSLLILNTKDLPDKTSTEFTLLSLGLGAAHTERMKNSSYLIGAKYYNFSFNDSFDPQYIDWQKDPEQKQFTFQYKWKPNRQGLFKFIADYSDTRLSLNIFNLDSLRNDLVSNTNKNLYLNANYEGNLVDKVKLQTGVSYNKTSESGDINALPYHQTDDVLHGRFTLTKSIFKKSNIVAGADIFSNKRDEGYGTLDRGYSDVLSAGYLESELALGGSLTARIGGRAEYSSFLNDFTLSPRSTLIYKLGKHSQLLGTYGVFYEKPDDSYLSQTSNLQQEKATHYIFSYEYSVDARTFRVETYYKNYSGLTKINTPVFSGLKSYGPVVIDGFNSSGSGYAKGVDIFWRDMKTIPLGEYYVSYSFVDSRRNYLDWPAFAQPAFAPKHTINIVARKYFPKYYGQLSGTYTFASGRTYYNPLSTVFLGDKTQTYNNLSTTISYLPALHKKFTIINFTVANVPGFNNVFGYRYATNGMSRLPILPTAKRNFVLSILLNIGDANFNY